MLLEQAILQLMFFMLIELVLITVVAAILFIALIVMIRKSGTKDLNGLN